MSHDAGQRSGDTTSPAAEAAPAAAGRRTLVAARYPQLARKLGADASPTIDDAATAAVDHKDGGAPVDRDVGDRVGGYLGVDFAGVRVHQDGLAQEATAAMGARAFAHGHDVFLGAGESGSDLSLMAHELTHVAQQGAAGQRMPQRRVEVGAAGTPAEAEADAVAGAVTGGAAPAALLVDDGPVQPGQMLKSTFIEQLREQVSAAAAAELGPLGSIVGCPFIDQYFARYAGQPAATGEALIKRYAPAARAARSAADLFAPVVARVREGVQTWRETGQPPADIAAAEPTAAAAASAGAAPPGAGPSGQALRSPDGRETLASLEAELGPGAPLAGAPAGFAAELGVDVARTRVHAGPIASAKAAAVDATAFAVGEHIVLGAGAPAAGTIEHDALLAHELGHVVQQQDAAADPIARRQPIGPESASAESAVDAAGEVLVADRTASWRDRLGAAMKTGVQLQRCNSTPSWAPPMPAGSLTPGGSTPFLDGAGVDAALTASPTVSPYLASRISGGDTNVGRIHFHPAAEFRDAWLNYASRLTNPDTGATFTQAEAEAWFTGGRVAGFRDGNELHINQDSGQATDTIHESIHRYRHSSFLGRMGFAANEGVTEHLTQRVCAEQTPPLARTPVYASENGAITRVVGVTGVGPVADAYFNGNISGLETAMDAASAGRFASWVGFMNRPAPDYAAANALFP